MKRSEAGLIVETTSGQMQGRWESGLAVFHGIPYASRAGWVALAPRRRDDRDHRHSAGDHKKSSATSRAPTVRPSSSTTCSRRGNRAASRSVVAQRH